MRRLAKTRRTLVACVALSAALPAAIIQPVLAQGDAATSAAQPAPNDVFERLTSGKSYPLRLQLKSLTNKWRRLTVSGGEQQNDPYGYYGGGARSGIYQQMLNELGYGVYYTKGQSVTLGEETYLIAYRVQMNTDPQEMQELLQEYYGGGGRQAKKRPVKFSPNTVLALSLLNLRTSGNLNDVRPFNPTVEILQPRDIIEQSNENMERLGKFVQQYISATGGRLPNMANATQAMRDIRNQTHMHGGMRFFQHPQTREMYKPNWRLSRKNVNLMKNKAKVVVFYEPVTGSDKKRGVLYLDGQVRRVPEAQWNAATALVIPAPGPTQINYAVATNLKRLNQSLLRNIGYRGGKLPKFTSAWQGQRVLMRYTDYNNNLWKHPATGQSYRANMALSELQPARVTNRAQVVTFYEAKPAKDGTMAVVYMDGRVERVTQARWNRLKAVKPRLKAAQRGRSASASTTVVAG